MKKEDTDFDFQEALKAIQNGQALLGKAGILNPLIKKLTEAALEGEIDSHLAKKFRRTAAMIKAKRQLNLSMAILNFPHRVIGAGLFHRNWSRNIKRLSQTRSRRKSSRFMS